MRQAIVIQNPKWEPFTKASDAFKSAKAPAVLVVRGRSKEKRDKNEKRGPFKAAPDTAEALAADLRKAGEKPEAIEKAVNGFKAPKAALALLLALFAASNSFAQAILTGYLPATSLTAQSTNSNDGGSYWALRIDQEAAYQLTVTATNAHSAITHSNIWVYLDTAIAGSTWKTNAYVMSFDCPTNISTATSIARLTNTVGGTLIRVGKIANPNTNFMSVSGFYMSPKD